MIKLHVPMTHTVLAYIAAANGDEFVACEIDNETTPYVTWRLGAVHYNNGCDVGRACFFGTYVRTRNEAVLDAMRRAGYAAYLVP
jgi:hypothetical protein